MKRNETNLKRAIAYYRHSAQDKQENSIDIQKDHVHKFAKTHNIEIIKEFEDEGKSGLSTMGRDAFNDMIENYVIGKKEKFDYILVLDVSRWGRFQDGDLAGFYTGICKKYGIQVIFTSMGFLKENDLFEGFIRLPLEGYRAAAYSRELSGKVFMGQVKIVQQGFRAGGMPPYALHRMLLDEQRNPVTILKPGQRKSIQNQRVTLAPGDKNEVATINRVFNLFVKDRLEAKNIAGILNGERIASPGRKTWNSSAIYSILTNELYIGTMLFNKTSQKLQSKTKKNDKEDWIRKEEAFMGIVDKDLFMQANQLIEAKKKKYEKEEMLARLKTTYDEYGMINGELIRMDKDMVSPSTYAKHFNSIYMAYQMMYKDALDNAKQEISKQLATTVGRLEHFDDFILLDNNFRVTIQPSVPISSGQDVYWYFEFNKNKKVDITLGVPLSNNGKYDILGYLVFPMLLINMPYIKISSSSDYKIDFYGYSNLSTIKNLLI